MKIKVMSYNTLHCQNYLTKKIDFDMIADTIKKCEADIVGLQEIRGEGPRKDYEAQARIIAEKLGFYYYFAEAILVGGENPYGNAIVSRYPIASAETIPIPDPSERTHQGPYETRCVLKATLGVGEGLNVLVTHFGLNPDEQTNAVETVLANLPDKRCVLMGDFNVTPENPILAPLLQRLFDTAERFSSPKFSFPSDAARIKIDYVLVTDDVKVYDADIPEIVSSDHRPHIANIEIDEGRNI